MVVYLDLLALINLFFNFLLLTIAGWLGLATFNFRRYSLSALAGTAIWFIYFFLPKYIFINWLCRIGGGLAMTLIAWRPASLKDLVPKGALLLVAGQLVGGGIYSLAYCFDSPPLGRPQAIPAAALTAGGVLAFGAAAWFTRQLHRSKALAAYIGKVDVEFGGKTIAVTALLDSGNTLTNPVNGWPVVILERKVASHLLTPETIAWLDRPFTLPPESIAARVALIPYASLGAQGLLGALRPEQLVVSSNYGEQTLTQVYIALRPKAQPPLEYPALAFPWKHRKEGEVNCKKFG